MDISITIKFDAKRTITLSLEEAKELAENLGAILKETQYIPSPQPYISPITYPTVTWDTTATPPPDSPYRVWSSDVHV